MSFKDKITEIKQDLSNVYSKLDELEGLADTYLADAKKATMQLAEIKQLLTPPAEQTPPSASPDSADIPVQPSEDI